MEISQTTKPEGIIYIPPEIFHSNSRVITKSLKDCKNTETIYSSDNYPPSAKTKVQNPITPSAKLRKSLDQSLNGDENKIQNRYANVSKRDTENTRKTPSYDVQITDLAKNLTSESLEKDHSYGTGKSSPNRSMNVFTSSSKHIREDYSFESPRLNKSIAENPGKFVVSSKISQKIPEVRNKEFPIKSNLSSTTNTTVKTPRKMGGRIATIFVVGLDGKTKSIIMEESKVSNCTVSDLKKEIFKKTGVKEEYQRLMYVGKELQVQRNGWTMMMNDYGIKSGSTIMMEIPWNSYGSKTDSSKPCISNTDSSNPCISNTDSSLAYNSSTNKDNTDSSSCSIL